MLACPGLCGDRVPVSSFVHARASILPTKPHPQPLLNLCRKYVSCCLPFLSRVMETNYSEAAPNARGCVSVLLWVTHCFRSKVSTAWPKGQPSVLPGAGWPRIPSIGSFHPCCTQPLILPRVDLRSASSGSFKRESGSMQLRLSLDSAQSLLVHSGV